MLSLSAAVVKEIVRKNLDELNENYSDVLGDTDSEDLDTIIVKSIAQAANHVHEIAPQDMLEGKFVVGSVAGADGVSTFEITDNDYLRLVRCKPAGSSVYLRTAYNEDSPQGRMQLNPYTKATSDNPCLIVRQGTSTTLDLYGAVGSGSSLEYVPIVKPGDITSVDISTPLVDRFIDQLTGMVLLILGETDKAQAFIQRAMGNNINQQP